VHILAAEKLGWVLEGAFWGERSEARGVRAPVVVDMEDLVAAEEERGENGY
jgi:hypothetical protein